MAGPPFVGDRRLEDRQDVGPRGGPGRRLDLEPVVGPRVVAGGDHDPGRGAPLDDLVARHLGRDGVAGDRRPGCRGRGATSAAAVGEVLAREPAVVGDDDTLGLLAAFDDVVGDPVGAAPDVLERVLVGDPGSPAVRAEDDLRRGRRLGDVGHDQRLRSGAAVEQRVDDVTSRAGAGQQGDRRLGEDTAGTVMENESPVDPLDDKVVRPGLGRLAGLDHPTVPGTTERREQRRPAPEVAPADVHRAHHDLAGDRRGLHDGVVDRDRSHAGIGSLEMAIAEASVDRIEDVRRGRREGGSDRSPLPEEHPGVPGDSGLATEDVRSLRVRLLLEPLERIGLEAVDRGALGDSGDEVAVFGRRSVGLDAERDERGLDPECGTGDPLGRVTQHATEDGLALDHVVGRQDDHDLVLRPLDGQRREGDRRGRVPALGLLEHARHPEPGCGQAPRTGRPPRP